jgi:hypothetical protein
MFHIITPFSRTKFFGYYLFLLENENVTWHPVLSGDIEIGSYPPWVVPLRLSPIPTGVDPVYWKMNRFIEKEPIVDNDLYMFLCDDDSISKDFISKVRNISSDVAFVSMKRGMNQPPNGHPTSTLIPFLGVKAGSIGFEQMIMKGSVLKQIRFIENSGIADGLMAEYLQEHYPIHFCRDAYILFNFLEKGRWE